jgi:hypothetical protein
MRRRCFATASRPAAKAFGWLRPLFALAREALEDAGQQHVGGEGQVVGDGAEHHGVAEAHLAEVAAMAMASKDTTS